MFMQYIFKSHVFCVCVCVHVFKNNCHKLCDFNYYIVYYSRYCLFHKSVYLLMFISMIILFHLESMSQLFLLSQAELCGIFKNVLVFNVSEEKLAIPRWRVRSSHTVCSTYRYLCPFVYRTKFLCHIFNICWLQTFVTNLETLCQNYLKS